MKKNLSDIIYKCPVRDVAGDTSIQVNALHFD